MPRLIVASEAIASGSLTRRELARGYDQVYRNVHVRKGCELDAVDRAVAAWLSTGRQSTMAGLSAAALLGSKWVPKDAAPELYGTHHRAPAGIVAYAGAVGEDEKTRRRGIGCTTAARTAYDLGRRLPFREAVIRVDALLNATGIPLGDIEVIALRYPGARNIRRLRRVLDVADAGAESPQETVVRLLLISAGLPRPETQIKVGKRRVDMGWRQWRVGVEYDGEHHFKDPARYAEDIDRHEFFADQRWRIVRVVGAHVRYQPNRIPDRAARALTAAGWRREAA